jgi:pimeloyl-ACP methyl ester carboxylesterase
MLRTLFAIGMAFLVLPFWAFAETAQQGELADAGPYESDDAGPDAVEAPFDYFARDTFRIDKVICPFKSEIDYEPGDIECGLLQVPENREDPDSRFIELHYVKISSTWDDEEDTDEDDSGLAPGKRDDPIIYLTGGPGVRVSYYLGRLKDHKILKHRDLYILEQRGIGHSGEFCPFFSTRKPENDDVETFEAHLEAAIQDNVDCAKNAAAAGVDLAGYNSVENARDVKALRRALGFEKWNAWGISYGSILGQAYLKQDSQGIRAAVLDAIVPLDVRGDPLMWRTVKWYIRDLKKLDDLCKAQDDCSERYPNLADRLRRAVESVKDNPIVVEVKDKEAYPSGKARFFTDVVAFLPFMFLYEQSAYPGVPGLIYTWADAVERRDETVFKAMALAMAKAGAGFMDTSQGMASAILCSDGDVQAMAAAGELDIEEYPILGASVGTLESYKKRAEKCSELGMAPRDASEFTPVRTDIPTLIIEGDMDPITPPPSAKAILPGFVNGTYVEFPWAGHGPSRSVECAGDMLNKFFDKPNDKPDLSCVKEMEPPDFYAPMFTTSIGPRFMLMALEDKKSLAGPIAWGAFSILIPLIAFFVLTIAPIGRRIDKRKPAKASWARLSAWLASFFSVLSLGIFGGAIAVTYKASEGLLLFGLASWAGFGAFAGLLAGLAGIGAIVLTIRAQIKHKLPIGTLLGFLFTAVCSTSLSAFLIYWDMGLF